jgi:transcription elongation GreA/GreB family factor
MFKKKLIKIISNSLIEKIKILEKELKQINYEKNNQTKSSAGDKYETSRSSMQIEYDKLNSNLQNLKINLNKINLIDSYKKYKKVSYGALVKTKSSYYLISVGLGKFIIEGKNVFIISLSSPVGKNLFDKKKDELISINNIDGKIIEIL